MLDEFDLAHGLYILFKALRQEPTKINIRVGETVDADNSIYVLANPQQPWSKHPWLSLKDNTS